MQIWIHQVRHERQPDIDLLHGSEPRTTESIVNQKCVSLWYADSRQHQEYSQIYLNIHARVMSEDLQLPEQESGDQEMRDAAGI